MKFCNKISDFCLVDGGSGSDVMPKIIEELGLQFSKERPTKMVAYKNSQYATIGKIKDVTLVLFILKLEQVVISK